MLAYQYVNLLKSYSLNIISTTKTIWLEGHGLSFIERNPELSVRQTEGLSVVRAKGLSREEVNNFYDLLIKVLIENDLSDKPERIYNMDESGIQLNNKPGKVVAKKAQK